MQGGRKQEKSPKPGSRKLYPCQISVRCTAPERKQIQKNARLAGRSLSRFLVQLGARESGDLMRRRSVGDELAAIERWMFELRELGFYLNQILSREHLASIDERAEAPASAEIVIAVRAIRVVLDRIREHLR